jgi:hypothetical protein
VRGSAPDDDSGVLGEHPAQPAILDPIDDSRPARRGSRPAGCATPRLPARPSYRRSTGLTARRTTPASARSSAVHQTIRCCSLGGACLCRARLGQNAASSSLINDCGTPPSRLQPRAEMPSLPARPPDEPR